jgi:hypothetical protein
MPLENGEGRAMGECNVNLRPCEALKEAIPYPSKQTKRSLCVSGRHGKRKTWLSLMMIVATDDVFHDAAGGVGRGRERPSYHTALPDLHVLLEPVFAGEDTVTVRWTAHGAHRGDSEMVWHRLGGVRQESQQIPPTGKLVTWSGIDIYHLTDTTSWEAGAAWIGWVSCRGLAWSPRAWRHTRHKRAPRVVLAII